MVPITGSCPVSFLSASQLSLTRPRVTVLYNHIFRLLVQSQLEVFEHAAADASGNGEAVRKHPAPVPDTTSANLTGACSQRYVAEDLKCEQQPDRGLLDNINSQR